MTTKFLVLLFLLMVVGAEASAQVNSPSIFAGFGAVAVNFREISQYTSLTQRRESFKGGGVTVGAGFDIGSHTCVDLNVMPFTGNQMVRVTFARENYFELKGLQVPVGISRMITGRSQKFNMSIGGGVNFLKARLTQYKNKGDSLIGRTTFSTPNIAVFTSFRWRLAQRTEFNINVNVSLVPRFAGTIGFALRYTFRKKEQASTN